MVYFWEHIIKNFYIEQNHLFDAKHVNNTQK